MRCEDCGERAAAWVVDGRDRLCSSCVLRAVAADEEIGVVEEIPDDA